MAIAILTETPGGTKEQYEQVIGEIGLTGSQLAPGQLVHFAGPTAGGWQVVTVWESQEVADKYLKEKVKPARQKFGLPETPPKVFPVHRLAK
jgi:hypothetical protein